LHKALARFLLLCHLALLFDEGGSGISSEVGKNWLGYHGWINGVANGAHVGRMRLDNGAHVGRREVVKGAHVRRLWLGYHGWRREIVEGAHVGRMWLH